MDLLRHEAYAYLSYLARRGTPLEPRQLPQHDTIFFMNAERRRTWRFDGPDGSFSFEGPGRVVYPSKRHLSPRIRAFIDFLVERLQRNGPAAGPGNASPAAGL